MAVETTVVSNTPGMQPASRRDRRLAYLAVAAGSALGGALRWSVSGLMAEQGGDMPWATLIVNVGGSFLIGAYASLVSPGGPWVHSAPIRLFFMTGFCGGFTTFSMFGLETLDALHASGWRWAAMHALGSVLAWLGAAWAGFALAGRTYQGR